MTRVDCYNIDCLYCDVCDYSCNRDRISIGEEYEMGCDSYFPYYENGEYNERYYVAVKVGRKAAKAIRYRGKLIEYNGRIFFTDNRITADEGYYLTDKRTGVSVGTFAQLQCYWDKFIELEKQFPDVETLPLAEYDECGKYKFVERGNAK